MTGAPPDETNEDPPNPLPDVTELLQRASEGAAEQKQLFEMVYEELRALARGHMRDERAAHTLQPTVLVHEAWMRLGGGSIPDWQSRAHFFGAAAEAMRRVLVDHARKKATAKRGGGLTRLPSNALELQQSDDSNAVLEVDEALTRLGKLDERLARVVRLRFWAGLNEQEVADLLELSPRSVRRDWKMARAWLTHELEH